MVAKISQDELLFFLSRKAMTTEAKIKAEMTNKKRQKGLRSLWIWMG